MREKFPFILLAGSPKERDSLMEYADVDYKALIEVNGKPMINYVLDALISSDCATYILITGIPEELVTLPDTFNHDNIGFLYVEGRMVDKVHAAAKRLMEISREKPEIFQSTKKTILTTGDIPALTPKAVQDFADSCAPYTDSFYHSMVSYETMEAMFPGNGRSFMHLKDISLCGGDLDMVDVPDMIDNFHIIKKLTENRKFLVKAIFTFSPWLMLRYLFKRIKFEETPRIMHHFITVKSRIVVQPHAVIGFDVDKPFQLDMMREYLSKTD